jgi:hypothetical protein
MSALPIGIITQLHQLTLLVVALKIAASDSSQRMTSSRRAAWMFFEHVERQIGHVSMLGMADLTLSISKGRAEHIHGLRERWDWIFEMDSVLWHVWPLRYRVIKQK